MKTLTERQQPYGLNEQAIWLTSKVEAQKVNAVLARHDNDLQAQLAAKDAVICEMKEALEALGSKPDGYCFCIERAQVEAGHTGECLYAQKALSPSPACQHEGKLDAQQKVIDAFGSNVDGVHRLVTEIIEQRRLQSQLAQGFVEVQAQLVLAKEALQLIYAQPDHWCKFVAAKALMILPKP